MSNLRPGVVSVVLVNFRGTPDTIEALRLIRAVDWDVLALEIIVVENGSGDDSAAVLRAAAPDIKLVVSKENLGFAGGCNLGVKASTGEYVAFLNNDAKPDAGWIRAAVSRFEESPAIGGVASKVLDWDGKLVDYVGSAMTWFGQGYKPFTAQPQPDNADRRRDVLFGTGSAMFVRRRVYDALDGFDERYFMFFEDVDLGWRMNLRGWRFVYEPASIAYHKHHASMTSFGSFKETYLLERNALFTQYKNLGEDALRDALPATMALAIRRSVAKGDLDSESLDIRRPGGDLEDTVGISKTTMAGVYAIDQFVEKLPSLKKSRDSIQAQRVVSDAKIWRLFGESDAPSYQSEQFLDGYENLVTAFQVTEAPPLTRVLIITGDPLGAKMAGPAIRSWNMALALAKDNDVTLVSLSGTELVDAPFNVVYVRPGDERAMGKLEKLADVIIFQGLALALFDCLRSTNKVLVADVYDPMHLEQLEQARTLPAETWKKQVSDATDVLNEQLARGDFFLCASERQRHFYLGQLAALGRVNPANYASDPDLTGLIAVVPFGLDSTPPRHEKQVLKGILPGIGRDDKVLLWSGGLYNWFDPKILIRAVAKLTSDHGDVRLFFQGTKHPHPGVPEMEIVGQSRELARQLGVLDSSVFFNPSWVDYSERQNFLTEADAGVSTHFDHIETTFSFRTRILDYLWAELPMVVTEGDHFAELVQAEELGVVVPANDAESLAAALEKVLFDEKFISRVKANIHRVREDYYWNRVLEPLVSFVADARPAGDRLGTLSAPSARGLPAGPRRKRRGLRHDLGLVVHYLNNGGPKVVLHKIKRRLNRHR
ncbi:glycosyltransferase [Cryobacterium luteum]|uniref:Glycosyltransferase n=1 Tax=Cryobacterium luteum TaxID=1424661 RepID=A0A1H8KQA9_9MICO|nr:glycosyltransferase [Cryobacterium luteum]TFB95044.1 glycosyltransferase [Cryobacterium luteum]SEN95089.1 hypothetical protein SAMN05216281_12048 [Cryobacterium luteum]